MRPAKPGRVKSILKARWFRKYVLAAFPVFLACAIGVRLTSIAQWDGELVYLRGAVIAAMVLVILESGDWFWRRWKAGPSGTGTPSRTTPRPPTPRPPKAKRRR